METLYLKNIPQEMEKYGLCKTYQVRYEVIHIKHIFTEIFVRKTIDIEKYLEFIGWNLFDYMTFMTNRLRKIHHFNRLYRNEIDKIIKHRRGSFFNDVDLYNGLKNIIVLDFDGVTTKTSFHNLYEMCIEQNETVICSANPTIKTEYFTKRELPLPNKIYSCKGKTKKIKKLIEISKKFDNVFYIDDEEEYLTIAWLLGFKTYIYRDNKIIYFTLKSK